MYICFIIRKLLKMNAETLKKIKETYFKDLTQGQLARLIGCTAPMLSLMLNGKKPISMSVMVNISKATGYPLEVLMWSSTSRDSIPEEKREMYDKVQPVIKQLIEIIFQ